MGDNYYANRFHKQLSAFSVDKGTALLLLKAGGIGNELMQKFEAHISVIMSAENVGKQRGRVLRELELLCNGVVLPSMAEVTLPPTSKDESILPKATLISTRDTFLINVTIQANACYEARCYDAASVMMRKLIESLIIAVYEGNNRAKDIQNGSGDFLMLSDLIQRILGNSSWNLARETRTTLPKVKALGDRAAHTRRYLATKSDVDSVTPGLRVVVDDLLHLAKMK